MHADARSVRIRDLPEPMDGLREIREQFLAGLNFEIRTPLSGILGSTDLLLETKLDEEQQELVSTARACAENLLEMLNATLELSALVAGNVVLENSEFDLAGCLRSGFGEHYLKAEKKGLDMHWHLDPSLPATAIGDAVRLREILSLLVSNALKFTTQGVVEVTVSVTEVSIRKIDLHMTVRDTGVGIPSEDLEAVFHAFRQADRGLSRATHGLGIGLALVQRLVMLMDGEIEAESSPGQGSTFLVKIPLSVPSEITEKFEPEERLPSLKRILVVDDNDIARRSLEHCLKRAAYDVEFAASGLEALAAALQAEYDLILMDLQMPEMDGFTTTSRIRQVPGYQTVPIIALTANATDECRALSKRHGMNGFLAKPVQREELLATLDRNLR